MALPPFLKVSPPRSFSVTGPPPPTPGIFSSGLHDDELSSSSPCPRRTSRSFPFFPTETQPEGRTSFPLPLTGSSPPFPLPPSRRASSLARTTWTKWSDFRPFPLQENAFLLRLVPSFYTELQSFLGVRPRLTLLTQPAT